MSVCNICGGSGFGSGPFGRMSIKGFPPRCEKCQSLERHRTYRQVFNLIKDDSFKSFSFLQFSQDKTVEPDWFASHEVSIFGGDNSLDLQDIDRESHVYDIVMCNHVLEHVADDNAALSELLRVTKETGFVFLTVPSPLSKEKTTDWGYPKKEQHGHYRIYGRDFEKTLVKYLPSAWIAYYIDTDPVTGSEDIVFFLSKSEFAIQKLIQKLPDMLVIQKGLS